MNPGILILLACAAAQTSAMTDQPVLESKTRVVADAPAKAPTPQGQFATAEALLDALETADIDLRRLSAEIMYDRTFALAGDRQIRKGELSFVSGENRVGRKFAVRFDTLIIGDSRRDEVKQYIFDGQWLVEKTPGEKRFVKRQIVPPGQNFDPLRVGEGFMPIPIGQRKADILKRYVATLAPLEEGLEDAELRKFVMDCTQLKLTPRPDLAEEDQFSEIRLWYKGGQSGVKLLPRLARAVNIAEDVSLVRLINVKTNDDAVLKDGAMDTTTPPAAEGWEILIHDYREGLKPQAEAPDQAPAPEPAPGKPEPAPSVPK